LACGTVRRARPMFSTPAPAPLESLVPANGAVLAAFHRRPATPSPRGAESAHGVPW
jgi:hypothetical protein